MRHLKLTTRAPLKPRAAKPRRGGAVRRWPGMLRRCLGAAGFVLGLVTIGWFVSQSPVERMHTSLNQWLSSLSGHSGLIVRAVRVDGRSLTSKEEMKKALAGVLGAPLLSLSPHTLQKKIEALPWVSSAVVRREWPTTLAIILVERYPAAVWRKGKKRLLVDREGVVLTQDIPDRFKGLLTVAGDQAPTRLRELETALEPFPELRKRVALATLIGRRRWDLRLDDGITIQLPEEFYEEALQELSRLLRLFPLSSRFVRRLDFRLPDRLIVNMTPEGQNLLKHNPDEKST